MSYTTKTLILLAIVASLLALSRGEATIQTATFQHGVNGWYGGQSVAISEGPDGPGGPGSWNQDGSTYADGVRRDFPRVEFSFPSMSH